MNIPRREVHTILYAHMEHIIICKLPAIPSPTGRQLAPTPPTSNILALVTILDTSPARVDAVYDPVWYKKTGARRVVDIGTIQCLIGRIRVGNQYGIVDRSYGAERTEFLGTEDGFESEDNF